MAVRAVPIRAVSEVREQRIEDRYRHQPCAETRIGTYIQPALWQDVEALSIRGRVTTTILQAIQVIAPLFHANSNFIFEINYSLC